MSRVPHILLAEDDPWDRELTVTVLEDHHVANDIVTVADGAAVLDHLERRGPSADRPDELPAVVLLDLKLPKINGIEVLRRIKSDQRLGCVPVVVLTGSREPRDRTACCELGADAYMVKPLRVDALLEAIKAAGLFWAVVGRPSPEPDDLGRHGPVPRQGR